jgi:hypothetical protein
LDGFLKVGLSSEPKPLPSRDCPFLFHINQELKTISFLVSLPIIFLFNDVKALLKPPRQNLTRLSLADTMRDHRKLAQKASKKITPWLGLNA